MTARDAEDALAALRLLPARADQSLDHRGSIILGVKRNPLARAPIESFASHRKDHTRSLSSLPGVTVPMPPSTLKELERRQRQPQQRVYRDPVSRTARRLVHPLTNTPYHILPPPTTSYHPLAPLTTRYHPPLPPLPPPLLPPRPAPHGPQTRRPADAPPCLVAADGRRHPELVGGQE